MFNPQQILVPALAAAATFAGSTPASAAMVIIDSGTSEPAPPTYFESHTDGNTWTRITGTAGRGQTFAAPLIGGSADGEAWGLTAITIQTFDFEVEPATPPSMQLLIYEWDGALNTPGQNGTVLYDQTAVFPVGGTFTGGDHVTFVLGDTIELTEGENYAFYAAFTDASATFRPRVGSSTSASHPGSLINNAPGTLKTNQDLEFYLVGAAVAVPEPASLALLGIGGLLAAGRRRRV